MQVQIFLCLSLWAALASSFFSPSVLPRTFRFRASKFNTAAARPAQIISSASSQGSYLDSLQAQHTELADREPKDTDEADHVKSQLYSSAGTDTMAKLEQQLLSLRQQAARPRVAQRQRIEPLAAPQDPQQINQKDTKADVNSPAGTQVSAYFTPTAAPPKAPADPLMEGARAAVIQTKELRSSFIARSRADTMSKDTVENIGARSARILLPLAALGLGAASMQFGSQGYQLARSVTRQYYVDPPAEAAMKKFFPTALSSRETDEAVARVLYKRGYTNKNTLFGSSICPDEVNGGNEEVFGLMRSRWGESFTLGGLGGIPFAGKSGFGAYVHHVPENGNLFVLFAPHVGISADGSVGKLQRVGQKKPSTACGASIGAFKTLVNKEVDDYLTKDPVKETFDIQIKFIAAKLKPLLKSVDKSDDQIAFVTYQMYKLVREFLVDEIVSTPDMWGEGEVKEISVLGGIMINRDTGGDFFQPLLFESRTQEAGSTQNLFKEAFGAKPDLAGILGDKSVAKDLIANYPLDRFSGGGDKIQKQINEMNKQLANLQSELSAFQEPFDVN